MYDQILLDLGKGAFFKAFLALLIFGGGLAAQGKLTPMLSRLTPWGRTIAILVGVQAGQAALSLDAGVTWTLAVGRALPPIAILLVAHYFPSPAAPPADAPPVAPAGPSAAAKLGAKLTMAVGALVLGLAGCGATTAQVKTVTEVAADACTGMLDLSGHGQYDPFCATAEEIAKAIESLVAQHPGGGIGLGKYVPSAIEIRAEVLVQRAAKAMAAGK